MLSTDTGQSSENDKDKQVCSQRLNVYPEVYGTSYVESHHHDLSCGQGTRMARCLHPCWCVPNLFLEPVGLMMRMSQPRKACSRLRVQKTRRRSGKSLLCPSQSKTYHALLTSQNLAVYYTLHARVPKAFYILRTHPHA